MIKVLFVCLGNICRSPMAEAIFRSMVESNCLTDKILVDSCGTASYHTGEPPHIKTRKILKKNGISADNIKSSTLNDGHLAEFDFIIAMDENNLSDILRLKKADTTACIKLLSDFAEEGDSFISVPDPWHTGNFELTFDLIAKGCKGLLAHILLL